MYYVGDDEMTYRDSLIYKQMHDQQLNDWYNEILSTGPVTELDSSMVNKAVVLSK